MIPETVDWHETKQLNTSRASKSFVAWRADPGLYPNSHNYGSARTFPITSNGMEKSHEYYQRATERGQPTHSNFYQVGMDNCGSSPGSLQGPGSDRISARFGHENIATEDGRKKTGESTDAWFEIANVNGVERNDEERLEYMKTLRKWRKLDTARQNLLRLRVILEQARRQLAAKQDELNIPSRTIHISLKGLFEKRPNASIEEIGSEIERLWDSFLVALREVESKCRSLEEDVLQAEFKVQQLETDLYDKESGIFAYIAANLDFSKLEDFKDSDSETSSFQDRADESPEKIAYFSQLGNVELLREQVFDLRSERRRIVAEQESRAPFGVSLDEESLQFLKTFDQEHEAMMQVLEEGETELRRLQMIFEAKVDTGEHENENEDLTSFGHLVVGDETLDDQTLSVRPPQSSNLVFYDQKRLNELLIWDDSSFHPLNQSLPELTSENVGSSDYVNTWLLHQMRQTPSLVRFFTAQKEIQDVRIDSQTLVSLHLETWFRDETGTIGNLQGKMAGDPYHKSNGTDHPIYLQGTPQSDFTVYRRPKHMDLLQLGPNVRAVDIVSHALGRHRTGIGRSLSNVI